MCATTATVPSQPATASTGDTWYYRPSLNNMSFTQALHSDGLLESLATSFNILTYFIGEETKKEHRPKKRDAKCCRALQLVLIALEFQ
jgi:hypothetical protein